MAIDFAKLLAEQKAKNPPSPAQPVSAATASPEVTVGVTSTPAAVDTQVNVQAVAGDLDLGLDAPEETKGAPIEYPGLAELSEKISSLETAFKQSHPAMDSLLQTIHRNLQKDPELVHILKPEQTAIIFAALQKKTNTKIVQETVKSASSGRNKGLKNLGLEDL